ncbi:MAG TPA: enoyl-CoA hydratase [Kribbellaceae bacterium]|jgi:enoyl-CoA hydratase
MTRPLLLSQTADRVAILTLNRPQLRNALNAELCRQLRAAAEAADRDEAIDAIILTGADPAFCAGLDLREYELLGRAPDGVPETILAVGELATPVIGAINGAATTGGLELALGCDFLVASERALFADTHARVGLLPGGGMSVRLPQAVGLRRAKEMSYTGNFLGAEDALRCGLVNHVVPHEHLLDAALGIAAAIVSNQSSGVHAMKALYERGTRMSFGDAFDRELELAAERRRRGQARVARSAVIDRGRRQVRGMLP